VTDLALLNANVLDVEAGTIVGERTVHITDGRIEEVSSNAGGSAKRSIDLKGLTLMPGLCDGHVHVTAATANFPLLTTWSPAYVTARAGDILHGMLMRGFTTVRDAGGADHGLVQAVEEGYFIGPRILFAGKALSQTGGPGWDASATASPRCAAPRATRSEKARRRSRSWDRAVCHHRPIASTARSSRSRSCWPSSRKRKRPISTRWRTPTPRAPSSVCWSAACAQSSTATCSKHRPARRFYNMAHSWCRRCPFSMRSHAKACRPACPKPCSARCTKCSMPVQRRWNS